MKELHRLPPLPQDQTSAPLRYLTTITTAAQRLRAMGRVCQGESCWPTSQPLSGQFIPEKRRNLGVDVPLSQGFVAGKLNFSLNVTTIADKKAESALSIGAAWGSYNFFPVPPRQVLGKIGIGF